MEVKKTLSFLPHFVGWEAEREGYMKACWPEQVNASAVFVIYPLRKFYRLGQPDVVSSGALGILNTYSSLIQGYDRYLDTKNVLPALQEIKQDRQLNQLVEEVVGRVANTGLDRDSKRDLIRIVNRSRYTLYQIEQKATSQELSSREAFKWREVSAGTLLSTCTAIFNKCLGIQSEGEIEESAYWYGANIQLLDDMADIGIDITIGRQTPATLLLKETGEIGAVAGFLRRKRVSSFEILTNLAPISVAKVEEKRREYLGMIKPGFRLSGYHEISDPSLTSLIFKIYSQVSRPVLH